MRQTLYGIIMLAIPAAFAVLLLVGYLSYRKITYPGYSCGSFALMDDQIGWVLKPGADSCIGGRDPFSSGPPLFESKVYTDDNGFRSAQPGGALRPGSVMAVGDSWTFGFGVSYEQSYPAQLEQLSGHATTIVASPGYSTAQSLLLAERWLDKIRPAAIVFLERGSWARAACRGNSRPTQILKPCYWQSPSAAQADLVWPPEDHVKRMASLGILPGGILGAGETGWSYFLLSRPYALAHQSLVRFGLASGFSDDFQAEGVDRQAIKRATIRQAIRLADMARVPLLLIDSLEIYTSVLAELPPHQTARIHRIGNEIWYSEVIARTTGMAPADFEVPHDGHFGPGMNRLVAELIDRQLRDLNVIR